MKKKKRVSGKVLSGKSEDRLMRRFIKKLVSGVLKRQTVGHKGDVKQLIKKFKEVEEVIEKFAREMARQGNGKKS